MDLVGSQHANIVQAGFFLCRSCSHFYKFLIPHVFHLVRRCSVKGIDFVVDEKGLLFGQFFFQKLFTPALNVNVYLLSNGGSWNLLGRALYPAYLLQS